MVVAALVLSIIGLVGSVISFLPIISYLALPISIVALVLAAVSMKKYPEKKGMSIAALVMSIIAVVLSGILLIACTVCVCIAAEAADAVSFVAPALLA